MIPRDILRTVRRIEIRTSRVVTESLAGRYHSVFRGRGVEFSEVREYAPGDDVRSIDWNVTSRMGQPYIKTFVEERELTVLLVVDISASAGFGTAGRLKSDVAAEVAAVIAFAAIRNLDRVGLLLFSRGVDLFLPPARGVEHVLRVVREVLCVGPRREEPDWGGRSTRWRACSGGAAWCSSSRIFSTWTGSPPWDDSPAGMTSSR